MLNSFTIGRKIYSNENTDDKINNEIKVKNHLFQVFIILVYRILSMECALDQAKTEVV